jgi:quinol monooxygenase YgiN
MRQLALLCCALLLVAATPASNAQVATEHTYVITYIDVLPESAPKVRELLLRYVHLSLAAKGRLGATGLQEMRRPERFALLEIWNSAADWQAQQAAPAASALTERLAAFSAGFEDRRLFEPRTPAGTEAIDINAPVQTIAHLDLIPPAPEELSTDLATHLHALPGNLGAVVLRQANRGNHLSLWVQWRDERSWRASLAAPLMRQMRSQVGPQLGSPFDERVYQALH